MKKIYLLLPLLLTHTPTNTFFEFVDNKTDNALDKTFIQKLVNTFNIDVFFETGTYAGRTTENASKYFKKIHSVELHPGLFNNAKKNLSKYENITVYNGRSDDIIAQVCPNINGTILFWLDAHYSGKDTALGFNNPQDPKAITAIREELTTIKKINTKNCIILIDDIRGFGTKINEIEYMGCWAYPTIQEIQKYLLDINQDFELALLGDMLLAYDKTKYQPSFSDTVIACTKTRLYNGYNLTDEELVTLEKVIMKAPLKEKNYIRKLYTQMTDWKDPMFWHDLWCGLIELGSKNYAKAKEAFKKINIRTEYYNKKREEVNKIIPYNHWRIDKYLEMCS